MAKASKNNQNLTIMARVDGAGNVVSEVQKIDNSIANAAKTASSTSSAMSGMGDAFQKLGPKLDNLAGKMMGLRGSDPSGTIKNFAGALGLIPGPIGAVSLAVTSAIGIFTTLKQLLATDVTPATDTQEKSVSSLADAYLSLGNAATVSAAMQKRALLDLWSLDKERFDELDKQLAAKKQAVNLARSERDEAKLQLETLRQQDIHSGKEFGKAQKRLAVAEQQLAIRQKELQTARQELEDQAKQLDVQREKQAADEKNRKEEEEKQRKEEQYQRDLDAAIIERDRNDMARAERAAQQRVAEIKLIAKLREDVDAAYWASTSHSAEEELDRQAAAQKRQIAEQIKNAGRLAEAYAAIDEATEIRREKIRTDEAKKRAEDLDKFAIEAAERSSAQLAAPTFSSPELDKINQQLAALYADQQRWESASAEQLDMYGEQYAATMSAIEAAEQKKHDLVMDLQAKQEKAQRDALKKRVKDEWSFSEANQEAINAQIEGLNQLADGIESTGKASTLVQAAQMTASGLQAVSDAVNYGAEAAANFAIGNVATGMGLAAAAAGKTAAAVKYAKSLVELGFSAFDTGGGESQQATQSATPSASSLTGNDSRGATEINVTMAFSGNAGRLGRYLVEEINAEARTPGGARVNAGVIR